jgi:hypothetical protein
MKKVLLCIWSLLLTLSIGFAQDYYKVTKHFRISTGLDETAAIPFEDGIVYTTQSASVGASSPTDAQGRKLFTIFYLTKGGQKKLFREELVSQKHEGTVSFSGDNNTMVFCQQRPAANSRVDPLGLYFAERNEEGIWVNERAFEFNTPDAWLFSPSLSRDGKTLYFAANFEDSYGGYDIYQSKFENGAWSKPENLGQQVNSRGQELYPFIHPLGRLYFSSDGRDDNKGGYDLFMTAEVDGEWFEAIKLTTPINSLADDYQIWFREDFKGGYLTSNRRSRSKEIFVISTDIPEFTSPEPIKKTYYKYRINDRNLDTVDTELFRYSWVINDTLEIPGHDIIYEFPDTGFYRVKLHVYDLQLDTLLEPATFEDLHIQLTEQPVIECPDTIRTGIQVAFDATNSFLPGFDDFSYLWDFGDGSYGQGKLVAHTYLYPGNYQVTLGVQERRQNRRDEPEMRSSYKNVVVIRNAQ